MNKEVIHLLLQIGCMIVTPFWILRQIESFDIAAQQQQVVHAEEIQVDQAVFRFVFRKAFAYEVRHGRDPVFVLNSRGDGYRSGTFTEVDRPDRPVRLYSLNHFAVMKGDVNVFRLEFPQLIDDLIYALDTVTFQRRKNLK